MDVEQFDDVDENGDDVFARQHFRVDETFTPLTHPVRIVKLSRLDMLNAEAEVFDNLVAVHVSSLANVDRDDV